MPSHIYHKIIRDLFLGKRKKELTTDQILDFPYIFEGRKHRKHFHSLKDIVLLSLVVKNPNKFLKEAIIHIWLDKLKSQKRFKLKRRKNR